MMFEGHLLGSYASVRLPRDRSGAEAGACPQVWRDVDWERKRPGGSAQYLKRTVLAVFASITAVLGICADAADLFVPIATSSIEPNGAVSGGTKERLVRIGRKQLASVRDQVASRGTGRFVLNVDADFELGVAVERTTRTRWGYSLSGRIDDPTVGFVTLVVHDEVVAGHIWTPNATYELLPIGDGIHAWRDLKDQPAFECGGTMSELGTFDRVAEDAADHSIVDILVVYTPAAEERVRGWTSSPAAARMWIEAFNNMGIALANDAFERGGAFVSLNLIGIEKVDYEAGSLEEDWLVLRSDEVQDLRDNLGADLVHATVGCCYGAAVGNGFSYLTAGSDSIFVAHEVGHNFGLSHERSQWQSNRSITYPRLYQHGYVTLRGSRCTGTIMAYGELCAGRPGDQVPLFSSPASFHPADGARLGMSRFSNRRGADGPADAVLHLNRTRGSIAGLKPRRSRSD